MVVALGNGLAKLGNSQGGCVVSVSVGERFLAGPDDDLGGFEVGFPHLEVDDLPAHNL